MRILALTDCTTLAVLPVLVFRVSIELRRDISRGVAEWRRTEECGGLASRGATANLAATWTPMIASSEFVCFK